MTGHDHLLADLAALVRDAEGFTFHDHKSPHATPPKLELVNRLRECIRKAQSGRYDNAQAED